MVHLNLKVESPCLMLENLKESATERVFFFNNKRVTIYVTVFLLLLFFHEMIWCYPECPSSHLNFYHGQTCWSNPI